LSLTCFKKQLKTFLFVWDGCMRLCGVELRGA
jgi:hypothetical protein